MKQLLILIALFVMFQASYAQFAWEWINPKPQGNTLNDVFFTDTLTGYAVGLAGTLIKTTDGGNNWQRIYCGTWDNLNTIYFTDAYTGFIAGEKGRILKTTDAGQHWDSLISNTNRDLYSIVFVNHSLGFAVGDSGTVLKTTNGGITWNTLNCGTTSKLLSVSFADENTGFVVGQNGTARKTTDGGASWQALTTGTTLVLNAVHMLDHNHLYICGKSGIFLKSVNGGNSFTTSTITTTYNYDIKFITADTGFIAGKNFLRTTDGGLTWNSYSLNKDVLSLSIPASCHNKIFCVGSDGAIFVSDNQGASFTNKLTNIPTYYSDVGGYVDIFFTDANTGYILCYLSTDVLKTTDGGLTWTKHVGGGLPDGYSYAIHFPCKDTGYYCGSGHWDQVGTIFKTTNQGYSWTNLFAGTAWGGIGNEILKSIFFVNSLVGFTVGNYGVIYKTVNGGQSWITVSSGTTSNLNKVFFPNSNIGYIVGSAGKFLKTTDGGNQWNAINIGINTDITSLYFVNKDTGFIGTINKILKTTDGGNSWTSTPIIFTPISIHFSDVNHGFAVGGNTIIKTTDGGNTWNYMHNETANSLYRIFFTDSVTGFIIGNNKTILRTTTGGLVNTPPLYLSTNFVKIYPNPSSDFILIENNDNAILRLFDMNGKLVLTKSIYSGENRIDISTLKNGMYIAKIIGSNNIKTTKIIKN